MFYKPPISREVPAFLSTHLFPHQDSLFKELPGGAAKMFVPPVKQPEIPGIVPGTIKHSLCPVVPG